MVQERIEKAYVVFTSDSRVNAVHISLYLALLHCWSRNSYQQSFQITRRELMRLAHIRSIVTYHKIIKQLVALDYIRYEPSYNPLYGSKVQLKKLS